MSQIQLFGQPPQKAYYNTLPQEGKELVKSNETALKQNEYILGVIEAAGRTFTAWEMYLHVQELGRSIPKESVRRAMTTLMIDGKLEKTLEMRKGEYSVMNRAYKFVKR
jgi:hypothetical protein